MDIHIRTGALLPAFSFSTAHTHTLAPSLSISLFCYLFHSDVYLYIVLCIVLVLWCGCACVRLLCFPFVQYANPFFVERYDTLLMLHFRFATTMTASIWLCLVTNTHTQFNPSHFHHIFFLLWVATAAAAAGWLAGCSIARFSLSASPEYFSVSFRISEYHRKELRVAVGSCNLSLAYFLSFQ